MLPQIINSVQTSSWQKSKFKRFFQVKQELSVEDGILLKGPCIVIPEALRHQILQTAHSQHQGIVKCKALLREKVLWPGMSTDLEAFIASCPTCQVTTPSTSKPEPIQMTKIPDEPWDTVATDLKGPFPTGEHLLVLIDYRTRYPIVSLMKKGTSSSQIINKLQKTFALFGYPRQIMTDNGKQFVSDEFKAFLNQHNIHHHPVTPYWPQANGEVERFNRTIGKIIQCSAAEGKDWRNELDRFLLYFRTTPHTATGKSPSDLFFKHQARNDLPVFRKVTITTKDKLVNDKDQAYKNKLKTHADAHRHTKVSADFHIGETVLAKNMRKTCEERIKQNHTTRSSHLP